MNEIQQNVAALMKKYGNRISSNNKLVLMYWKDYCGIDIDSDHISTKDFLNKVKLYDDIINALTMLNLMKNNK